MRGSKGICLCAFMERYPIGMVETKRKNTTLTKETTYSRSRALRECIRGQ